jgi:osmotically-inducible protein OsmY
VNDVFTQKGFHKKSRRLQRLIELSNEKWLEKSLHTASHIKEREYLKLSSPYLQGGNTMAKTDSQITQDVLAELAWDPAVTVADLTVSTDDGRVSLTGRADTYGTKLKAEDAASRVAGVRSVENDIVVDPAALGLRSDADIARDIRTALVLDYQIPDDQISVNVLNGVLTLTGNVNWYYQRDAAEADAAMIREVQDIDDEIIVNQPETSAVDITVGIDRAFARNAELSDDNIDVRTEGSHVDPLGNSSHLE